MSTISKYEPRFDAGVQAVIRSGLESAGISPEKYPQVWEEVTPEYIENHYKGRAQFWVAIQDENVVGTIAIDEKDEETAEIKRMYVSQALHGAGVGQQLLETALEFARVHGYTKVYLETDGLMKRAHRFYEKNGFTVAMDYGDWQTYERLLT